MSKIVWKLLFLFMALRASVVKNSRILAGVYFISLKNALDQTWKCFNIKFGPQWKDRRGGYEVTQDLPLFFCNWVSLSLGKNCVKGFRITNIVKQIKFERVCDELEAKVEHYGIKFNFFFQQYFQVLSCSATREATRTYHSYC